MIIESIFDAPPCLLDTMIYTCNKCGDELGVVDGTWLPTGRLVGINGVVMLPEGTDTRFPHAPVMYFDLREPEPETSDEFTCYDCCPEGMTEEMIKNAIETGYFETDEEMEEFFLA